MAIHLRSLVSASHLPGAARINAKWRFLISKAILFMSWVQSWERHFLHTWARHWMTGGTCALAGDWPNILMGSNPHYPIAEYSRLSSGTTLARFTVLFNRREQSAAGRLIEFSPARDVTMKAYKQLTYEQRCQLYALNNTNHIIAQSLEQRLRMRPSSAVKFCQASTAKLRISS